MMINLRVLFMLSGLAFVLPIYTYGEQTKVLPFANNWNCGHLVFEKACGMLDRPVDSSWIDKNLPQERKISVLELKTALERNGLTVQAYRFKKDSIPTEFQSLVLAPEGYESSLGIMLFAFEDPSKSHYVIHCNMNDKQSFIIDPSNDSTNVFIDRPLNMDVIGLVVTRQPTKRLGIVAKWLTNRYVLFSAMAFVICCLIGSLSRFFSRVWNSRDAQSTMALVWSRTGTGKLGLACGLLLVCSAVGYAALTNRTVRLEQLNTETPVPIADGESNPSSPKKWLVINKNLGNIFQNDVVDFEIVVPNPRNEAVEFKEFHAGCSCLKIQCPDVVVEAKGFYRGTGAIKIAYTGPFTQQIMATEHFKENGLPQSRVVSIEVKGNSRTSGNIRPTTANLGKISVQNGFEAKVPFTIEVGAENNLPCDRVSLGKPRDGVEVSLLSSTEVGLGSNSQQFLSIKFAANVTTPRMEYLQIYCEGKNEKGRSYRLPMTVSFLVVSPVETTPRELIFMNVEDSANVVIRVDAERVKVPVSLQSSESYVISMLELDPTLSEPDRPSIHYYRGRVTGRQEAFNQQDKVPRRSQPDETLNSIQILDREGTHVGSIKLETL